MAIKHYRIEIETHQPVIISDQFSAGNVIRTLHYIPGSVWRGALANVWMEHRGTSWDEEQVLLDQYFGVNTRYLDCRSPDTPLVTADLLTCKHDHGYYQISDPRLAAGICPDCGEPLLRPSAVGWKDSVETQMTTHSSVDLYRQSVKANALVQWESMLPQVFVGEAWLDEELVMDSRLFKQDLEGNYQTDVYVGKKLTSGFGQATITLSNPPLSATLEIHSDRARLYAYVKSDTLLYDEFINEANVIELCRDVLPVFRPDVDWMNFDILVHRAWRNMRERASWNGMWRAPQQVARVIAPGSVFEYTLPVSHDFPMEAFVDAIRQAMTQGVGWRTQEGFGNVEFTWVPRTPFALNKTSAGEQSLEEVNEVVSDLLTKAREFWAKLGHGIAEKVTTSMMYRIRDRLQTDSDGMTTSDGWAANWLTRSTISEGEREFLLALRQVINKITSSSPTSDVEGNIALFANYVLGEYRWRNQLHEGREQHNHE